eukprot:RCo001102
MGRWVVGCELSFFLVFLPFPQTRSDHPWPAARAPVSQRPAVPSPHSRTHISLLFPLYLRSGGPLPSVLRLYFFSWFSSLTLPLPQMNPKNEGGPPSLLRVFSHFPVSTPTIVDASQQQPPHPLPVFPFPPPTHPPVAMASRRACLCVGVVMITLSFFSFVG